MRKLSRFPNRYSLIKNIRQTENKTLERKHFVSCNFKEEQNTITF